ncbi:MAG: DDE-type integrase/transposase/recombinase, partial [Gammaproteobacteria bacterium]|nr:DDE-type integrase/transposase/recombinase [Gammaproteobacteria bacterium]
TLRLTSVLSELGISSTTWCRPSPLVPRARGRPKVPLDERQVAVIRTLSERYPYWGYKRLAVLARREFGAVYSDRLTYRIMRDLGLLQRRVRRQAELHQSRQLFELLPTKPNELWQMDVTYLHLPQGRWWYIVSVIDYYSRYLLTCFLTPFQNATAVSQALELAIQESARLHGPLQHAPILVTDNGSSFLARKFQDVLRHRFRHVRIQYRTPQQLGLLERVHGTLEKEEVYFRIYEHPHHARPRLEEFLQRYNQVRPHWALRPAENEDPWTPAEVYEQGRTILIPQWRGWANAAQKKLEERLHRTTGERLAA